MGVTTVRVRDLSSFMLERGGTPQPVPGAWWCAALALLLDELGVPSAPAALLQQR